MLLLIDNYDSFTWNLCQYFQQTGVAVRVIRNDAITVQQMSELPLSHLVISPGPCTPEQSGVSIDAIRYYAGKIPVLGVCLGHQAIVRAFGGQVVRAHQPMHGKTSIICHDGRGVFSGLNQPLRVTRYHSLIADPDSLPDCLEISARYQQPGKAGEIMAIRHRSLAIEGVQFHPESILSEQGLALLKNFVDQTR